MSDSKTDPITVLIVCWLSILGTSIYYLVKGFSFSYSTLGQLIDCDIHIKDDNYYRRQTFQYMHNGANTTCSLIRQHYYHFKGDAENAVQETIIGTWRKIWITTYNSHTCVDETLKNYYADIGITLICIFLVPFLVILCVMIYSLLIDSYNEYERKHSTNNHQRLEIEL